MDRLIEFIGNHIELSAAFVFLLFALFYTERSRAGRLVSPQQATLMINRGEAIFLDIREKKDLNEGKITDALQIPYGSLKDRATELKKFEDKTIILVDKMGQHTGMAGKLLKLEGFDNVCRMSGGIAEWKNCNMPLIHK